MKKLWDISAPVNDISPVFPGDTPYQQAWVATIDDACPVNVSRITLSPHVGTHADAPRHYDPEGQTIGAIDLNPYLGPCRVIHVLKGAPLITWDDLAHYIDADLPPRVLVRTYTRMPQTAWDASLRAYAPETLERLAELGVVLVGIDTASIDPADSKRLDSHQVIRHRQMRVLENLLLDEVPEGDYELIALPLRLTQADASPVRAVLRSL
jgi:arylformamidase